MGTDMKDPDRRDESTPKPPAGSDDHIEALLRTTGRRPAAPAERAERVKGAVRAHWRSEVGQRSRGRRFRAAAALATAATVIVAVGLGLWKLTGVSSGNEIAGRIEMVTALAWSRPVSAPSNAALAVLHAGDEIKVGSELVTESAGRIAIRLGSGHSVRLDAGTRLRVLSDDAIALDRGGVYIDSRGPLGLSAHAMEIRTPFGKLRDIGTQFEARLLDASLRIRVREGAISLDGGGSPLEVAAGHELEIDREGQTVRRELTAFGAEWAWIAEITPMMHLEGRPLVEFLEWMARERGLRLRFTSGDIAQSASEITLNGSIAGMTLDQALDSVLPTCRMSHRIERNDLVVEPLAESTGSS